jgi:hypothetical protein
MSTIAYVVTKIDKFKDDCHVITWPNMANGDIGQALEMPGSADRSVQVEGTFGTGGNVQIQGSNDSTNYRPLTDPQGNQLDIATAKIEAVTELTRLVRPKVTAGDGTSSLTVSMLVRRPFK